MAYVNRLLLLAFSLALVGCQHRATPGESSSIETATPEALARQFVDAMSEDELADASRLFISRDELASLFSSPNFDDSYNFMEERFNASLSGLDTKMQGAQFVRMNMSFSGEPTMIEQGNDFGPLTLKMDTFLLDNVHAVLLIDGVEKDLKLDELIMVDGSWRLLDAVELEQ